jgi:hypothetical protein
VSELTERILELSYDDMLDYLCDDLLVAKALIMVDDYTYKWADGTPARVNEIPWDFAKWMEPEFYDWLNKKQKEYAELMARQHGAKKVD